MENEVKIEKFEDEFKESEFGPKDLSSTSCCNSHLHQVPVPPISHLSSDNDDEESTKKSPTCIKTECGVVHIKVEDEEEEEVDHGSRATEGDVRIVRKEKLHGTCNERGVNNFGKFLETNVRVKEEDVESFKVDELIIEDVVWKEEKGDVDDGYNEEGGGEERKEEEGERGGGEERKEEERGGGGEEEEEEKEEEDHGSGAMEGDVRKEKLHGSCNERRVNNVGKFGKSNVRVKEEDVESFKVDELIIEDVVWKEEEGDVDDVYSEEGGGGEEQEEDVDDPGQVELLEASAMALESAKQDGSGKTLFIDKKANNDKNAFDRLQRNDKLYGFDICYDESCNRFHMYIHDRAVHVELFKCTTCNKDFTQKINLITHERTHTGERPFKCASCNKCFARKSNLTEHERSHILRPYECAACNQRFTQKMHLIAHERIHSDERPFKCASCNKGFIQKMHLIRHERTHSGERPYKCETCNKGFIQKVTLIRHELTHSGEKPYKCASCNKGFTQKQHLTAHEQSHISERPYKCETCNQRFTQEKGLIVHERSHSC